ncbi:MAG TPA: acyltransferase [Chthoniobacter sp.]|nr:acyltransferase [Chthoniobacter sp.]
MNASPKSERFHFVDGLRGIAAFLVVFDHLLFNSGPPLLGPLAKLFPNPLPSICIHGTLGVQIFFVLSGYVIAHSLRGTRVTSAVVGNFILRRQARLDPPYWAAIVLALVLNRIELALPGLSSHSMPELSNVALNSFYLQEFFHAQPILSVAWTLCIEIQFYLVFISVMWIAESADGQKLPLNRAKWLLFFSCLGSLAYVACFANGNYEGPWFTGYWFYFAGGVICYWASNGRIQTYFFWMVAAAFVVFSAICFRVEPVETLGVTTMTRIITARQLTGLVTILLLFACGITRNQSKWLSNAVFQYLGKISYSLYLTHMVILSAFVRLTYKLAPPTVYGSLLCLSVGAVGSLVFAHLFYLCIEKPSVRFAKWLRRENLSDEQQIKVESQENATCLSASV